MADNTEPEVKRPKRAGAAKYSVTDEGQQGAKWTRFPIRVRAHRNPLADNDDEHPIGPDEMGWKSMYPDMGDRQVTVADMGCAYAGLLCRLAPLFPDTLMLGMEIRSKVAEFAQERIRNLRSVKEDSHHHNNISVTQGNAMKYLPNFFQKGQLERLFFCYPDPHWKKKNVRRRVIQEALVPEYAYIMKEGGLLYTVTDVKELADWMQLHLDNSPLFKRLTPEEVESDPYIKYVANSSEDAVRTEKQNLTKHYSIHRKLPLPPL